MKKFLPVTVLLTLVGIALGVWVVYTAGSPPGTVGGGWGPIHHAADEGDVAKVKRLLDNGADINDRTKHGWTPLHLAAKKNQLDVAKVLIERGADLNIVGWGATPMQDAALEGHQDMGTLLRDAGATVDVSSAAAFGWLDELAALLDNRPELLEPWQGGDKPVERCPCPLHYAAMGGHVDAVKLLLERGAVVDAADARRRTPLHYAAERDQPKIITLLIQAGHEVDAQVRNELTPLQLAAIRGHLASVRALLEHGADPAAAIEQARRKGHAEIVQLLEEWQADSEQ